jgi:general secretion pathway protein F
MARFAYKAVGADGEVVEGEVEAVNREAVIDRLHAQGQVPIRAEEIRGAAGRAFSFRLLPERRRVRRGDVSLLTRELATLLTAGLPLDRALSVLGELSAAAPVRAVTLDLRDRVRGGAALAEALEAHPEVFPNFYVGMVRAGEAGGTLEEVLGRLADGLERAEALRENLRSALRYPVIVVIMAVVSLGVLMTLVIPEFRPMFEDAGAALPLSTAVIIATSDFLRDYWWLLLGLCLALALALRQHNRTPAGRLRWDTWWSRAPLFGELIRKVEIARFARTLGTLLANGVSVLNALSMTTEVLGNRAVAQAIGRTQGRLAKGEGLSGPLAESGVVPGLALQLIQVGEETGQLESMLLRIADIYDDEVKRSVERLLSILVPLMTIALGLLIAAIIGSMMAAILSAYELPF